ncbi:uncharacterized protein LOC133911297 [Phragmites australis]|uniref:uncharacterized protein LOC133911297 n=1 Tax=Phragmites australis TaxID=29695 RepID=UPI002D784C47|nr:uncharacterized protein LOC133911297 [Phragmites australis]
MRGHPSPPRSVGPTVRGRLIQRRPGDRAMAGAWREPERDADAASKAREVCAASAAFASCPHRRRRSPRRPHFVDWYLVLAIGEAAAEDAVRRRYRQLALQLHPDKNRHPKAEVAFKIVSEAHACLTDKASRRAFDVERRASFCAACHDRHVRSLSSPSLASTASATTDRRTAAGSACGASAQVVAAAEPRGRRTPAAPAQALRDVQNRLRDECRVIDSCLRANNAAACARRRQSFPLFDPSDRRCFPDYPHVRPPLSPFGNAEFCRFEDLLVRVDHKQNQRWCRSGGESPLYQVRTAPAERTVGTNRSW